VWVSTPNRFHAAHSIIAANHGKHVVVEKPMAVTLVEAEQMIEAAVKNKIKLLCGHTQSFGPHIRTLRKIIRSGELGSLRALHVWAYTDWMLRPRTAEELDIGQGGGVPYRQGPHQIDTLRLLGGGMVRSVRGSTGQWFKGRPIPGYYSAFLEFEDGTPATLMHNGYGYFLASELVPWGGQNSRYSERERAAIRKSLLDGSRNENADKDAMRIGGSKEREVFARGKPDKPWLPNDLGILVATCERGDIRQSQYGLYVHSDEGTRDVPLVGGGGPSRRGELIELYEAVVLDKPIRHTGAWGMATLEVCLAMMQSARERREIMLSRQVPAPEAD
jgi:phthalate 4,5-cis-dihydrodiol dehydrogenase